MSGGLVIERLSLPEVLEIRPRVHPDERGQFFESWNESRYRAAGITESFVQDNVSRSRRGVIRGLHMQFPVQQGKLVSVLYGSVFDVAVDARRGSPRFGQWVGRELRSDAQTQLWIPPGFLHGFQATEEDAIVSYKVSGAYDPASELTVRWDDPGIGIEWPLDSGIVSAKDRAALSLSEIPEGRLPVFS